MTSLLESIRTLQSLAHLSAGHWVVVFRYDKIGDMIVTSPLMTAIKAANPSASILLVASSYNRAVMDHAPEVDKIVVYDPKASWRDRIGFGWALRGLKPNTVFVLSPGSHGAWLGWFSGAAQRGGMIMSYRRLQRLLAPLLLTAVEVLNKKKLDQRPDRHFHQSEVALRLAERCGVPRPVSIKQSAPASAEALQWAASLDTLPTRLVIHLGATWQACGLGEGHIAELVKSLSVRFPDASLLFTAGPADQDYRRVLESLPPHPRTTLLDPLSFDRWSAVIASATVVVTPDTGAVHLASAHHRPVVAVYAPDRFNAMTSLFGPWDVPYRTLRGGGPPEVLTEEIVTSVTALLT